MQLDPARHVGTSDHLAPPNQLKLGLRLGPGDAKGDTRQEPPRSIDFKHSAAGWRMAVSGTTLTLALLPHCWNERTFATTSATTQVDPELTFHSG